MSEYFLLFVSACVSAWTNLLGWLGPKRPPRILVVKLDHMGDVLLATPAIRALHEANPDVPVDALVAPGAAAALEGNPAISRVLLYDSRRYRRTRAGAAPGESSAGAAGEPSAFAVMREISRARYTTIVELRGDAWTLLLPMLAGARRRVDRGSVRMGNWLVRRFTRAGRFRSPLHEVETNLEAVRPLLGGSAPQVPRVEITILPAARETLRAKVTALGVDLSAPYVCVQPGATWRPRAWRPERFAAIAGWIREHYHAQVLFVGSADEKDVEAEVQARVQGRAFWLFGALSWSELAALLEKAALFLGNDGGVAHLAAACGTRSVVLFGPQEPGRFRPWSERSVVLHHRVHCCPCPQTVCVYPELPCVNRIEPVEVQNEVARALGPPPAGAP